MTDTATVEREARAEQNEMLRVENLVVEFGDKKHRLRAVDRVSFSVARGETLSIVGESGCGKSSTARAVLQLPRPTGGRVLLDGRDLVKLPESEMRSVRRQLQVILQDPIASLNPRRRVYDVIAEGLRIWGVDDVDRRVREAMRSVGLEPDAVSDRLPSEFSGGQCQRISIARALVLEPDVLICDEPVSALDVSVQAQIVNLLEDLKQMYGLTMIFVSHDLGVVKVISDRVMVMYLGRICEIAESQELFDDPKHPYTRLLIEAVPTPDPDVHLERIDAVGEIPSVMAPPSGCRFRTRCPLAQPICAEQEPELRTLPNGRQVACHFADVA